MSRIEELYSLFRTCSGVSTDTRNIAPGNIYFALRGERFDGNEYAREALRKGALLAVVDDPALGGENGLFMVENTLAALQELAGLHRNRLKIPLLAITGSNGKTTTKELVVRVLSSKYEVGYTRGNLNNHIGVPLTILGFDHRTTLGVVEMGANHEGEIMELCRIAEPDTGLITNIGIAHIEGFGSQEGVFRAKTEMVDWISQRNGSFLLNADDPWLMKIEDKVSAYSYGTSEQAAVQGELLSEGASLLIRWKAGNGNPRQVSSPMPGAYNLLNILAAIATGIHFGIDPADIDKAVSGYIPDNNRSQVKDTGKNIVLLDAYNANPSSMEAALRSFIVYETDRTRMLILGDMFELGEISEREHQNVAELAVSLGFDRIWLVGPEFSKASVPGDVLQLENTEAAIKQAAGEPLLNMAILIKGSRGMHLEDITSTL